jgi:tRNA threonylcarbamoyladenosine biosynthesis protein TsaE
MQTGKIISHSEEETIALGFEFAQRLILGNSVSLFGQLGAGKTEFIKGICRYFKVEEIVTSPTFTIINQYSGIKDDEEIVIYHIDLYRIKSQKEFEEIGFEDCLYSPDAIKLIEWADKVSGILSTSTYTVTISLSDEAENDRIFEIEKIN